MAEPNKYHTSKIYKISSSQCNKFYIGSTIQTLNKRLSAHKTNYKSYEKGIRHYTTSYEVVKYDDAIIELIKDVKCENRKQLEKIEGECILEHHNRILNKRVEGRTRKEYYEMNSEKIKGQSKANYEANKDKKKEYYQANKEKLHEKFNCECGGKYIFSEKARHAKTKMHQLFIHNNNT